MQRVYLNQALFTFAASLGLMATIALAAVAFVLMSAGGNHSL